MSTDAVHANAPGHDRVRAQLKAWVRHPLYVAQRDVNTELVQLFREPGTTRAVPTEQQTWGSGVVTCLAVDLRACRPVTKGYSIHIELGVPA
jgi:hypothetical protein